jgi:hypothetical protein
MRKTSTLILAVTVGVTVTVLALPVMAEPRHRHLQAGWEAGPAQAGLWAEPWQKGLPGVIEPTPLELAQNAPLEILPPAPGDMVQKIPMPAVQKGAMPCGPACGCPPQRRIVYRNHCRPLRKGDCLCAPPIQTVLVVPDGRCCQCAVEVPVCIPACCTDAPQVEARRGLLGRTRVLYRWCCGFEVEVVFCGNGDLIVHYDGL